MASSSSVPRPSVRAGRLRRLLVSGLTALRGRLPLANTARRVLPRLATPASAVATRVRTGGRERRRRASLGVEGRIAEDAVRAVRACQPVWAMLEARELPEDVTLAELDAIHEWLLGRPRHGGDAILDVTIRFSRDAFRLRTVRASIPAAGDVEGMDGYRYATLTEMSSGRVEPFLVGLLTDKSGVNEVVATMFLDTAFLRYEQEFGVLDHVALTSLSVVLLADLADLWETQRSLRSV